MKQIVFTVLVTLFMIAFVNCSSEKGGSDKIEKADPKPDSPKDIKKTSGTVSDKSDDSKLSASHILLMHKASERVPKEITRTKEEALALAKDIHAKLKAGGDFAELAKKHSDCPSKDKGGDLGTFPSSAMAPAFTQGLKAIRTGQISEPVETPFGYHIIKRQEVIEPITFSASMIVVLHKDSKPNPENATRTKEEALAMANEVIVKLKSGADFAELAKKYSDHPSKMSGGNMGNLESDRIPEILGKSALALKIGEFTAEPLDTPIGYYVFKRQELAESIPMSASIILVSHKDSKPNLFGATRAKEEALAIVKKAMTELKSGTDFAEVAKKYSDHPNKDSGGHMGTFPSDKIPPELLDGIKPLNVGEFTPEPLDVSVGYHIFLRNEPDQPAEKP
ncbi:MAG: hypothetical protein GY847_18700 [Proteobacteria bacterium]|nr:hypothetical protein [Pseudomonadota bacterium]